MEQFIGCDAHKKFSVFIAVNEKGQAGAPRGDLDSLQGWVELSDRGREPIEQACIVIIDELHRKRAGAAKA
jgi:hypothetical protein